VALTLHERRLARLKRRLEELRSWRNARETPVDQWKLRTSSGSEYDFRLGDFWPAVETPVLLLATAEIPNSWAGSLVELELSVGGEGLVRLSTGYQAGLNPFHHRFPVIEQARGGESIGIEIEAVPKGLMGSDLPEPRILRAMLAIPSREIRALERDLTMIYDAAFVLTDHEAAPRLLDAAEKAVSALAEGWPTSSEPTVSRYVLGYDDGVGPGIFIEEDLDWIPEAADARRPKRPTWSLPAAPRPLEPMDDKGIEAVVAARHVLAAALESVRTDYPPIGKLALTGHAHIDLAWLWPLAETRRKARRTFSSVLDLMERYPDFTFNQSSAQVYEWIAEDDPPLFERIKNRVSEGRWEPSGGMWVEADANITGGEAFARQLIYGQRYFEQTFGQRNIAAWLPDVFGYSGGMPQLLRGAGLTGFFTTKLNWSEANVFPFDLFEWEGIDGSTVTVHTFFNPGHGYNGNIAPLDTQGTWRNFKGKGLHDESLLSFGWGDGAGGPSERMLENYARIKDFPVLPRLRMSRIDDFFATLPPTGLPRWVGELYLELHRGTLTTQATTKQLNRQAEHRLLEAEAFGAIASLRGFRFPSAELERAWKTLLLNQFHDILPGSSINEVYQDTHRLLGETVASAEQARNEAIASLGGRGEGWTVANAALAPRSIQCILPGVSEATTLSTADGRPLLTQVTEDGLAVDGAGAEIPPLGSISLVRSQAARSSTTDDGVRAFFDRGGNAVIENGRLRVEIGPDGTIHRLFDREAGREALSGRGNQLWAYVDWPYTYDAWDVDETYERDGEEISAIRAVTIVEEGPLRTSVRVERFWRDSAIVQTYRLWRDARRLDIDTDIDWRQRHILLKARFPLAIHSHEAIYETMYGVVRRPTHRNTSWDAAKFEVCGHRFAEMSEPGYGVALLNDAKYGYDAQGNVLSLSLLRSPTFPDPLADEGEHRFTYSLFPHPGDWTTAEVTAEAFRLNSPPIVVQGAASEAAGGFVAVEGIELGLGSLKPAFEGEAIILRVYEPHGSRGSSRLTFDRPVRGAARVNLLEEPDTGARPVQVDGSTIDLDVRPFEIVTLRIEC
jgi:alpha-mannosidase